MLKTIIGNETIQDQLANSIKTNKTSHSYLFIGIEGIGKKMIAKEFAKQIVCLEESECGNTCKSCIEFDHHNNPDVTIIEPDGTSIKIDQIRQMQKKVYEKPILSKKKVYIINDSNKMTTEAQNCLLKTLEEPPEFVVMILIGNNENAFLSTIKSRCMIIRFKPIENEKIQSYLKENYDKNIQNERILTMFEGSIGKAIARKDKQEQYETIENLIRDIKRKSKIEILKRGKDSYGNKEEIEDLLDYTNYILLDLAKEDSLYTKGIQIVENTKRRLKSNANYDMTIDNMMIHFCEEM